MVRMTKSVTGMSSMTKNNCIKPPHFPPHCGCPAGVVLEVGGEHERSEDGGSTDTRGGHE